MFYRTPLFFASQIGDLEAVNKILSTAAANVDSFEPTNHWTPLFVSAFFGYTDIVSKLLEYSANVHVKDKLFGWTPLLASVWNGHLESFKLLSAHSPLNVKDNDGRNAVILAVQRHHIDLIDEILKTNVIDINDTDNNGRTALYFAVQLRFKDIILKLVEYNANLEIPDKYGRKPLFIAYKLGYEDIAECLVSLGADTEVLELSGKDETGDSVYPCQGIFVSYLPMNDIQSTVKVLCFCECNGKIWGGCNDGSLLIWDSSTMKVLCYYEKIQKKTIHHIVNVDDTEVWSLSGNKEIYIWKFDDDKNEIEKIDILTTNDPNEDINCIIRVDENHIYGGGFNGNLYIWNIKQRKHKVFKLEISAVKLHDYEKFITSMSYSNGILYVVLLKYIFFYDIKTLTCRGVFEGHTDIITSIFPHSSWLWTASRDNTIRIWNINTKECVKILNDAGGGQVTCMIGTSHDQVLTGGSDGRIRSWNIKTMNWKKTFCLKHHRDISCLYWQEKNMDLWVGGLDKNASVWK